MESPLFDDDRIFWNLFAIKKGVGLVQHHLNRISALLQGLNNDALRRRERQQGRDISKKNPRLRDYIAIKVMRFPFCPGALGVLAQDIRSICALVAPTRRTVKKPSKMPYNERTRKK